MVYCDAQSNSTYCLIGLCLMVSVYLNTGAHQYSRLDLAWVKLEVMVVVVVVVVVGSYGSGVLPHLRSKSADIIPYHSG